MKALILLTLLTCSSALIGQNCALFIDVSENVSHCNSYSGTWDDCINPCFCHFGESNEYFIPNENSPLLEVRVNFHIIQHGTNQTQFPNFDQDNEDHIAFLLDLEEQVNAKLFARSVEERCNNVNTGRFSMDSRIRIRVQQMLWHTSTNSYFNNNQSCDNEAYDEFILNQPQFENALNVLFIEPQTNNGGCGPALAGETSPYLNMVNSFTERYFPSNSFKEWPNFGHELGHCFGLFHPNDDICVQQSIGYGGCVTPINAGATNDWNHFMNNESTNQTFVDPNEAGQMRRYLLTTWRKKWLINIPNENSVATINENTVWHEEINVNGDIVIEEGVNLTLAGTLLMKENSKIFVKRGAKMIIDGGLISTCSNEKWQGIFVEGASKLNGQLNNPFDPSNASYAGTVIMTNGATIDNAYNAITTENRHYPWAQRGAYRGGLIYCNEANFTNCDRAVEFMRYGTPKRLDKSSFHLTNFVDLKHGVTNWASDGVTFTQCHFENIEHAATGGRNAAINVYDGNTFVNVGTGVDLIATKQNETSPQIGLDGTAPNNFQSGTYGVYCAALNNFEETIIANNLFNTTVGVFIDGPNRMNCIGNDFSGPGQAIFAIDTDDNRVFIDNNHFLNKGMAITAFYDNAFTTLSNNTMDGSVEQDVWVYGILTNPGQINFSQGNTNTAAGNCFTKLSVPEIVADSLTTIPFEYFVKSTQPLTRQYPSYNGNFSVNQAANIANSDCDSGIEGGAPPPVIQACIPGNTIQTLRNEIQDLDIEIQQLKSNGGSFLTINERERCLSLSLNALAHLYADNLDYTSSNGYFAARPEFSKRIIPFSNKLQQEEYLEARQYLNALQTSRPDEVDFITTQNIYLDYLETENYALPSVDSLHLVSIGIQPNPLNGYARSTYYAITGERIQIPLPANPRFGNFPNEEVRSGLDQIMIYPNPLKNDELTVRGFEKGQDWQLVLQDLNGRTIDQFELPDDGKFNLSVELAGIYFITIRSEQDIKYQKKLIILR